MKEIILGVYADYYHILSKKYGWEQYPFTFTIKNKFKDVGMNAILNRVFWACVYADKINFVLNGVHFPLNPEVSRTCGELELVLSREDFLQKTQFWHNKEKVDTSAVLEMVKSGKNGRYRSQIFH